MILFTFQAEMPISWFQLLKCERLLLFLVLYNCESSIFGSQIVDQTSRTNPNRAKRKVNITLYSLTRNTTPTKL